MNPSETYAALLEAVFEAEEGVAAAGAAYQLAFESTAAPEVRALELKSHEVILRAYIEDRDAALEELAAFARERFVAEPHGAS